MENLKPETEREIINKAWAVFNAQLNQGLEWNSARETAVEEAEKMKASYDDSFCIDDQDRIKQEAIWTRNMNYFDLLIQTIQAIK